MLFHSFAFLIFFPAVVCLYFLLPFRIRWILLLGASYLFYGWWRIEYLALILVSTVIDYGCALGMARNDDPRRRKRWLWLSLAANLGLLGWFKYASFFNESARGIAHWLGVAYPMPYLDILLPVGISFYTFQSLSYTIDVYRGHREPERHFGLFALYVAFFPQLVAGPIERSTHLLPQFRERHRFTWDNLVAGLRLMVLGYFLKLVIADRLAPYVNEVYAHIDRYEGVTLLLAAYFFPFQIYGDFAGYSFIAIGAARVMGYRLMENFRRPYFAPTVSQYWREWHISLNAWFRDYVYVPLGGSRMGAARRTLNLVIVFTVSGLWHGAKWNMVLWGALHGLLVAFETATAERRERFLQRIGLAQRPRLCAVVQAVVTFHIVAFGLMMFRSASIAESLVVYRKLVTGMWTDDHIFVVTGTPIALAVSLGFVGALNALQLWQGDREMGAFLGALPRRRCALLVYGLIFSTLLFGAFTSQEFFYFQF